MSDSKKKKKEAASPETAQAPETEAVTEETTAQETPVQETPAQETPAQETPAQETAAPEDEEKKALEAKLAEANDRLMRTLAEYDNFRKRSQKEKEALYNDVKAETIAKLLPVADNLERAAGAEGDLESYKKGVEMTLKQTHDVFASLGVECFGEKGAPFDPNLHNGVMHEENDELPENTVSDVFMKGYKLGDKVIRHATVKVAN